ncbi:hypothetical protein [Streptomyces sp. NPDC004050]
MFAFGRVIAYAAAGAPPFPGEDVFVTLHRVLTPRLEGLDGMLGQLVERALD